MPGPIPWQSVPTQPCATIYKRKLPSRPTEKKETWIMRGKGKLCHWTPFLPNNPMTWKLKLHSLTCSLLQQLSGWIGCCLGRIFCYFLQWICKKGRENIGMSAAPNKEPSRPSQTIRWQNSQTVTCNGLPEPEPRVSVGDHDPAHRSNITFQTKLGMTRSNKICFWSLKQFIWKIKFQKLSHIKN